MATVGQALIDIDTEGSGEAQSALSSVGGALSSLGGIALGVAAAGIAALAAGVTFATSEAMSAQDAVAALNATLAATDGAVGLTSGQLQDMASALQDVTRFSDEAAMAAETMLLRFENIGSDVFPQALKAAADLATAMGTDLVAAAQAVGRALDNPAEGIGRLNTQLKLFSKEEMTAIQKMAEMGDVAGAQQAILDRLSEKVGGLAEAMGDTAAGKIERFKNKLGDLAETLGGPFLEALEPAADGMWFFLDAVQSGASPVSALEGALRRVGLGEFADGLREAESALAPLRGPLEEVGAAIQAQAPFFEEAGQQISEAWQLAFGEVGPELMANLQSALTNLASVITTVGPVIASVIGDVFSIAGGFIAGALQMLTGFSAALMQLATGDAAGALDTFLTSLSGGFDVFANSVTQALFGVEWESVKAQWSSNFAMLSTILSTVAGQIGGKISELATGVMDGINSVKNSIVNAATQIGNTAGEWAAAGGKLIAGLVGAIKAGAAAVIQAAVAVAIAAVEAVKRALGISSPSRVMWEIGANLTGTLADAISGGMSMPIMAAGDMGAAVGGAVASPVASAPLPNMRPGGGNTYIYTTEINSYDVPDLVEALSRELGTRGLVLGVAA